MKFWQLGNTSVRSALRIRDGLVALSQSSIQGNIRNVDGDIAFRELLGKCGVVSLGSDATNSVGRKWRSATYSADGNWFDLFSAVLGVGNYVGVRKAERRTVHLLPRDGNDRHYINACRCSDRNCVEPAILAYSA